MTLRPFIAVGALFILIGVNAFLLYKEWRWGESSHGIAPSEVQARHIARQEDPLIDLVYSAGNRKANLERMGLPDDLVAKTLDRLRDLDDRDKDRLRLLIENAAEPTELADAICGQTNQIRPRYGALRFLVDEDKGERRPVKIKRVPELERQDWSKISPIGEVFNMTELGDDRKPDATLMSIAAIIAGKEQDLLNGYKPWGRGFAATWSWKQVMKENPGIDQHIVEYFALMHLTVELATGEEGLCGQ